MLGQLSHQEIVPMHDGLDCLLRGQSLLPLLLPIFYGYLLAVHSLIFLLIISRKLYLLSEAFLSFLKYFLPS